MKTIYTLMMAFLICLQLSAQQINTSQSSINFSADYLGFGSVDGSFLNFNGNIDLNQLNIEQSVFDFTIDANSVSTKSKRKTRFLKGEEFFNTLTYDAISFASNEVKYINGGYSVFGDLTIKNITKSIEIPFDIIELGSENSLVGNLLIDRFEFDLGSSYKEWIIGRDINVEINCVLTSPKMEAIT